VGATARTNLPPGEAAAPPPPPWIARTAPGSAAVFCHRRLSFFPTTVVPPKSILTSFLG
jgi:hypothetical protein